jgi:hypothetical protein
MPSCPNYIVSPGFQLGPLGGSTGPYDCTAWADRVVIATSTCGAKVPTGRTIRLQSNEPVPDPRSPGLNLFQAEAVAAKYGVNLDVRVGYQSVTWAEYERRRKAGQPAIIQVNYAAIADSKYDAGRGFRGGHALAETTHATYDSLADGRAAGVFRWNGTIYTRAVIQSAAARLDIGGGAHPRPGTVWAAFGPDVVPSIWGSDVPADIRAVDIDGYRVAAAIRKTGTDYKTTINMTDLETALRRAHIDYKTSVNPIDVVALLNWAKTH